MIIKNRLREHRVRQGVSQLELARRTKMAPGVISDLELCKRCVYPGWRKRIAKALGVPEAEIFPQEVADHAAAGK